MKEYKVEIWNDFWYTECRFANEWALKNCESFIGLEYQDMSDFNYWKKADTGYIFKFGNEDDATMFALMWAS